MPREVGQVKGKCGPVSRRVFSEYLRVSMGPGYGLNMRMRLIEVDVAGIQDLTLMLGVGSTAVTSSSLTTFCSWEPGGETYIHSLPVLAQFICEKNPRKGRRFTEGLSQFCGQYPVRMSAKPDSALTS
jgi:hypothetical protein